MSVIDSSRFENLDFDTTVTTSDFTIIQVTLNPDIMMDDYGVAVARDLQRRNPVRYQSINDQMSHDSILSVVGEDHGMENCLKYYFSGLMKIRVESVYGNCPNWRSAKVLQMTPYVQFSLTRIGECLDTIHGRKLEPCFEFNYDIKVMIAISKYIEAFTLDGVELLQDAFPRARSGDLEVMQLALVDSYVKGIERVPSSKSYVAAFLGMKLRKENDLKILYSVRYDDIDYVKTRLIEELTRW